MNMTNNMYTITRYIYFKNPLGRLYRLTGANVGYTVCAKAATHTPYSLHWLYSTTLVDTHLPAHSSTHSKSRLAAFSGYSVDGLGGVIFRLYLDVVFGYQVDALTSYSYKSNAFL